MGAERTEGRRPGPALQVEGRAHFIVAKQAAGPRKQRPGYTWRAESGGGNGTGKRRQPNRFSYKQQQKASQSGHKSHSAAHSLGAAPWLFPSTWAPPPPPPPPHARGKSALNPPLAPVAVAAAAGGGGPVERRRPGHARLLQAGTVARVHGVRPLDLAVGMPLRVRVAAMLDFDGGPGLPPKVLGRLEGGLTLPRHRQREGQALLRAGRRRRLHPLRRLRTEPRKQRPGQAGGSLAAAADPDRGLTANSRPFPQAARQVTNSARISPSCLVGLPEGVPSRSRVLSRRPLHSEQLAAFPERLLLALRLRRWPKTLAP